MVPAGSREQAIFQDCPKDLRISYLNPDKDRCRALSGILIRPFWFGDAAHFRPVWMILLHRKLLNGSSRGYDAQSGGHHSLGRAA